MRDGRTESPGAHPDIVNRFKTLAGDGSVDRRCRRIVQALRPDWGIDGPPFDCLGCGRLLLQRDDTGWDDYCTWGCRVRTRFLRRLRRRGRL